MKKMFIVVAMFLILISSQELKNDFTLLNYFSGEYTAYTEDSQTKNSVDLGFCYMQNSTVDIEKLVGESLVIQNFEPISAINKLNAKIVKTEYLDDGSTIIYAFTNYIKDKVEIDNKNVNLQIAYNDEYSIIGWPLILGSF